MRKKKALNEIFQRRLRAGIVGGGPGSFIGAMHRIAAELDGQAQVIAGAMSSDSQKAREAAAARFLPRSYESYIQIAEAFLVLAGRGGRRESLIHPHLGEQSRVGMATAGASTSTARKWAASAFGRERSQGNGIALSEVVAPQLVGRDRTIIVSPPLASLT